MKKNLRIFTAGLALILGIILFAEPVLAIEPSYTVSSSYKSGKYYNQLKSVDLSGNQARDIVNIALSQVGYHEGIKSDDLSGENTKKDQEYTEYAYMHGTSNLDWCAYFVSWCARQARIPASVIPKNGRASIICEKAGKAGTYYDVTSGYVPSAGDLIFFEPRNSSGNHYIVKRDATTGIPALSSHIGIVTGADSKRVYYIEGNAGEVVKSSSLPLQTKRGNEYWLQGYVHPNYKSNTTVNQNEEEITNIIHHISVDALKAENITTNNAVVYGHVSKPSSSVKIKTCGLYFGTSKSNMKKLNTETVSAGANNKDGGTGFDIWYDLNMELKKTLSAGTTYYYQFYVTYNENEEIKGDIGSFTTKKDAVTYSQNSTVYIYKGNKVACYTSSSGNTIGAYYDSSDGQIAFKSDKYIDLPNSTRRFHVKTSSDKEYWVTFDSNIMSVMYYASEIIPSEKHIYLNTGSNDSYILTFKQNPSNAEESIEEDYASYDTDIISVQYRGDGVFEILTNGIGTTTVDFTAYNSKVSTTVTVTVVDGGPPEFSEPEVSGNDEQYQVSAKVEDHSIKRFGIRTWPAEMQEEDVEIEWLDYTGYSNRGENLRYTCWQNTLTGIVEIKGTVYFSDFDKLSDVYITKLYAEDTSGNISEITMDYRVPNYGVARLAGAARYDTGFKVANALKTEMGVEKFEAVIVATGKEFADALAGSYLAVQKNAPILLTNGKMDNIHELHEYIKNNVSEEGTIYILGGEVAVPASVEKIEGYDIIRLQGATRYDTNLAILKEAGVSCKSIIVATGKSFADSLSASATKLPILLIKPDTALSKEAKAIVSGMENIYIIGGEDAVNADIATELEAYGEVTRVFGKSRYETSIEVAKTFFDTVENAVVASGKNFPDGLCGGPLASAMNAPLILTADGKTEVTASYMLANEITTGYVLGGTGALADESIVDVFKVESVKDIILK